MLLLFENYLSNLEPDVDDTCYILFSRGKLFFDSKDQDVVQL